MESYLRRLGQKKISKKYENVNNFKANDIIFAILKNNKYFEKLKTLRPTSRRAYLFAMN